MTADEILVRRAWLIEHVHENPGITKAKIFHDWERSSYSQNGAVTFGKSSFYKDIQIIDSFYGIHIKSVVSDVGKFYISNDDSVYTDKIQRWMLSLVKTRMEVTDCIKNYDRFLIEQFPSENGVLRLVMAAIESNRTVQMRYEPYGKSERMHLIEPYCIKSFKHRLYVMGKKSDGHFLMFAFDRIRDFDIKDNTFELDEEFNTEDFFKYHYGVFIPDHSVPPSIIRFRAYDDARYYLRDVPIHRTQREVYSCEAYADFEVMLYPTNDFLGDILQQAGRLEIISPLHVRQKLSRSISLMASRYQD